MYFIYVIFYGTKCEMRYRLELHTYSVVAITEATILAGQQSTGPKTCEKKNKKEIGLLIESKKIAAGVYLSFLTHQPKYTIGLNRSSTVARKRERIARALPNGKVPTKKNTCPTQSCGK